MLKIQHRVNTIDQLKAVPVDLGVEVDIRTNGTDLIIHHDPFEDGENFDQWLDSYRHRFIILNVKEEGLEKALQDRMAERGISDFFFLDQSFPFLIKYARLGEKRSAVRLSEFESMKTVQALAGMVDWVWVDYFSKLPIGQEEHIRLKEMGFKLCLVSPELQGFDKSKISVLKEEIRQEGIVFDAVCTKCAELW